jgi:acetyl-CoA acetyltransferase
MVLHKPESHAAITGIGQSAVGRRLMRDELDLTIDAVLDAVADAGLTLADIDGITAYPGAMGGSPGGFAGPPVVAVQDALRLKVGWHGSGQEGPAQLGAVTKAVMAVAFGLARHVVVYRTVTESTAQGAGGRGGIGMPSGAGASGRIPRIGGDFQYMLPYGAYSAGNWLALYAQRHMHEFGTTREQLGQIPISGRRNAAKNPKAIYTDPMTMEDYLGARIISTPFGLFDCDAPCDGSTVVIVSAIETAADAPKPVVRFESMGTALRGRPSWDQWDDLTTFACRDAAEQLWSRTDLKPGDVDTAHLYDGFSFLTLAWLEAMGFCGKGEAGPWLEGGTNIALDGGVLPINTGGGQLSAGRLHGFGHLHEAVLQLRGEGGARQVPGSPQVAAVAAGGGPIAGCLLLVRD